MHTLRFALAGGGHPDSHGRWLLNHLLGLGWEPSAWVPTILEDEFRECRQIARSLGFDTYWNLDEALDAVRPEITVVATPNHVHFEQCKASLERGIPVLSEKPLTKTLDEAKELSWLCQERNVPLLVDYSYTGHRSLTLLRQLIQADELGAVTDFKIEYLQNWLRLRDGAWRIDPKKSGALGAVIDIGSHLHDLLGYITGSPVVEVGCRRMNCDRFEVVVDAELDVRLANGACGLLRVSQIDEPDNAISLWLAADRANIEWNNGDHHLLKIHANGGSQETRDSGSSYPHMPVVMERCAEYVRMWQQDRVFPENSLCRTIQHGLEGMKFLDACERAWDTGQMAVLDGFTSGSALPTAVPA